MEQLIDIIRQAVIGENRLIGTPFGEKPLVYADYTASGRSLTFIEDFIRQQVQPFYANTHTEASFTGLQTSALREQARQIIREAVNGTEDDQIIFCGNGATAAIQKLIHILNLRLPSGLCDRYALLEQIPQAERPVVFIGPYEHHSNELLWRESIAELVVIPLDDRGRLNLQVLADELERFRDRRMKIGSFSAASNVTGLKTNVEVVTQLLHRHGAYAFWDYAAAGPYVRIDMAGNAEDGSSGKDAVFISPHKFIGGPGTPGILVVKRQLLRNRVPVVPGGGTVAYVTPDYHRYVEDPQRREEGGTPGIIESIRAGLVFKLQQAVGIGRIERLEEALVRRAIARWRQSPHIEILGNLEEPRLSIVSFQIKYRDKQLHYGFVVALLNDLFGIQARGGCSCAGPYGHRLLGLDTAYSDALDEALRRGFMVLRPGWVRLNFNYFISEDAFDYIVRAVELIAEHGWRLLPYYRFDPKAGVWRYQGEEGIPAVSLHDIDFLAQAKSDIAAPAASGLQEYLQLAQAELCKTHRQGKTFDIELPMDLEPMRWFVLPGEVLVDTTPA